jgi:hypothetical protein
MARARSGAVSSILIPSLAFGFAYRARIRHVFYSIGRIPVDSKPTARPQGSRWPVGKPVNGLAGPPTVVP